MSLNKIISIIAVVVLVILGIVYFKNYYKSNSMPPASTTQSTDTSTQSSDTSTSTSTNTTPAPTNLPDKVMATIDTNLGSFTVTLDHKAAPKTVENFVKLANEGFCNNTKFHRILKDFVIQGCDPNTISGDQSTWGQGEPGYTVPAEIGLKANVGAIGMASTQAQGPSSGSQFFIVTTESANNHAALDGNYTFFGYVTSGMDVVTKIASVPVGPNQFNEPSLPVDPVIINKITIK